MHVRVTFGGPDWIVMQVWADWTVRDLALAVARALDRMAEAASMARQGVVLDRSATLEQCGIHDGDSLEYVDVGMIV